MSLAVAPSPSIWTMGSPGTMWINKKTTETTSQMTGRVMRMRRRGRQRAAAVGFGLVGCFGVFIIFGKGGKGIVGAVAGVIGPVPCPGGAWRRWRERSGFVRGRG